MSKIKEKIEEEWDTCSRCGEEVEKETLVSYLYWELCEICQGDI